MKPNPPSLEGAHLIQTPVSEGRYTIDGEWYSVEAFCQKALDLDPTLFKPWTLAPGRPPIHAVASHEAAQVLRDHGHVVGNAQGPIR